MNNVNYVRALLGCFTCAQLAEMDIKELDMQFLLIFTLLLFVVSVLEERGAKIGAWISRQILPLRWAVLIGGVLCVLLMGVWGSGFDEASFIYYQF